MSDDDLDYIPTGSQYQEPAVPSPSPSSENNNQGQRELSDPPDPFRPNKYHGPAPTWREWTTAERDVSRSVDLMRARDLSVHLYNAHCLHIRAQKAEREDQTGGTTERVWRPSDDWTAWPLLPDNVPRNDAGIMRGFTERNDDVSGPDRARNELREILLACVTKAARRQFEKREFEEGDGHRTSRAGRSRRVEQMNATTSLSSESDSQSQPQSERIKRSHNTISRSQSRSSKRKRRTPSEEPTLEPVPLADDDLAMRLAQPSIEHIISSLENLLQALHTARQHYLVPLKPATKARKKSKGKRPQHHSDDASDSSASETSTTPRIEPDVIKKRSFNRYGKRNWKDILGLAAMLGWDSDALRRTRDRCAVLFGESVAMPVLDLDPVRKKGASVESGSEDDSSDEGEGEGTDRGRDVVASEDEMFGGVHVDGYMRPIKKSKGWRGRSRSVQEEKNSSDELVE